MRNQILVTFGLAIVLQEIIKYTSAANPIQTPAPDAFRGSLDFGVWLGFDPLTIMYPYWRLVYFFFAAIIIAGVFAFLSSPTFGMVVRAGMADRETVGLLGIDIDKRFIHDVRKSPRSWPALAGVMYTPIVSPNYNMGNEFLVLISSWWSSLAMGKPAPGRCWPVFCSACLRASPRCRRSPEVLSGHQPGDHTN